MSLRQLPWQKEHFGVFAFNALEGVKFLVRRPIRNIRMGFHPKAQLAAFDSTIAGGTLTSYAISVYLLRYAISVGFEFDGVH